MEHTIETGIKADKLAWEHKAKGTAGAGGAGGKAVSLSERHSPQKPEKIVPEKKESARWGSHKYALNRSRATRPYLNCDGGEWHGPESICGCGHPRCGHGYFEVKRGISSHGLDCREDRFAERVAWIKENCGFDPISGRSTQKLAEITQETLYFIAHQSGAIGRKGT